MLKHTLLVLLLAVVAQSVSAAGSVSGKSREYTKADKKKNLPRVAVMEEFSDIEAKKRGQRGWFRCSRRQRRGCYNKYGAANCFRLFKRKVCTASFFCTLSKKKSCYSRKRKGCRLGSCRWY